MPELHPIVESLDSQIRGAIPELRFAVKSRYVKVRSLAEAETDEMAAWIEEASRVPGWQ
jgi:hypothetical protein